MKRLMLVLALCAAPAFADTTRITRSSFTTTNDTAKYIEASRLMGVDIGAASTGGNMIIYNSTWTTNVIVSSISLDTIASHWYGEEGIHVKGIFYTIQGNTNGVTILYKK